MSSASAEAGRPSPWPARKHRYSIRTNLVVLVAACMLPALGALGIFVYQDHLQREEAVRRETLLRARSLMATIDRDLVKVEASLSILATSSRLAAGDIPAFADRLRNTPRSLIVLNYVLTDRHGSEVLNTVADGESTIAVLDAPAALSRVFETGLPSVSYLLEGPLHHQPVVALSVPVHRDGEVVYALTAELSPAQLGGILVKEPLPPHWVAALLDDGGTIVARSRSSWRYAGQKAGATLVTAIAQRRENALDAFDKDGNEVTMTFTQSSMSGLHLVIDAPRAALAGELSGSLATSIGGGAAALALALWFAVHLAGNIGRSVEGLIAPALALGNGRPVELPESTLKEAEAVGRALQQASRTLAAANHQAHHDALTGLCNRTLFDELVAHQLAAAARSGSRLAILAIDLDGFKEVNDRHGHGVGDAVLQRAAERIRLTIRGADVVSRRGGDEFTVLLNHVDEVLTRRIGDKLVASLAEPYPGVEQRVSASIGVALYPESGTTLAELLERADRALYRAKASGKRNLAGDVVANSPGTTRIEAVA